jgi:HK97 family phage prohead protease
MTKDLTTLIKERDGDEERCLLFKGIAAEVKTVPGQERTFRMVISDGEPDRSNDQINPKGWDLEDYRNNNVVQFAHDYKSLPIARDIETRLSKGRLLGHPQFPEQGIYAFADTVHDMLKGGFIRAASVGFKPLEWTYDEERQGYNFNKAHLLEWSVCPIPANPRALIEARAAGINVKLVKEWAQKVMNDLGDEQRPPADVPALLAAIETLRPAFEAVGLSLAKSNPAISKEACTACGFSGTPESIRAAAPTSAQLSGVAMNLGSAKTYVENAGLIIDGLRLTNTSEVTAGIAISVDDVLLTIDPEDVYVLELVEEEHILELIPSERTEVFIDIDPQELKEALAGAMREGVAALATECVERQLRTLRGRVD